jgi:SET domain-containing protein
MPMPTPVSVDDADTCFVVDPNPNQITPDIWVHLDAAIPNWFTNDGEQFTAISSEEIINNPSVCATTSNPQHYSPSSLSCQSALNDRRRRSGTKQQQQQQDTHYYVKEILQSNPTYFHPHLIVKSSALGGRGVFAVHDIPSKTFLCQYHGSICKRKDSENLLKMREEECGGEKLFAFNFTWNGRRLSVIPSGHHPSIYFNHALKKSPTNNVIKKLIVDGDQQQYICFFTKRHIFADEELLFDYEVMDRDILARPENAFLRR